MAQVVGPLVQDPGAALHSDRVTAAEVCVELRTVSAALIQATLEVSVFIKHDLKEDNSVQWVFNAKSALNLVPPTFPTQSIFGPHSNFWSLITEPYTHTTWPGSDLYMQRMWARSKHTVRGHHCDFN